MSGTSYMGREAGGGGKQHAERREAAGNRTVHAGCRGGLDCRFGAGHGEERTRSISCMFVTLDVSKASG